MTTATIERVVLPPEVRRKRLYLPRYIIIHTTQGPTTIEQQYGATIYWFKARGGKPASEGWGPCADIVIGHVGQEAWFVDANDLDLEEERANWSAGYGASSATTYGADEYGIAIELVQTEIGERPPAATLAKAVERCAQLCVDFDIQPVRLEYLSQRRDQPVPSGIVGHEDTENGRKTRKWDPNAKTFPWVDFIHNVRAEVLRLTQPPAELTPEQEELLDWLKTPTGRTLTDPLRRAALKSVGLDPDTKLPPREPAPVPVPPPTPMPGQPTDLELVQGGMQEVQRWIAAEAEAFPVRMAQWSGALEQQVERVAALRKVGGRDGSR